MHTRLGGSGGEKVMRWVKNNTGNLGLTVSSLQLLHNFSSVSAVDFDDVSSLGSGGYKGSVWVHCHSSDLCIVSWDDQVD